MEKTKEVKEAEFQTFIETCEEHELFFIIDEAGAFIWRMQHKLNKGEISDENIIGVTADVISVSKMQGKAAEQTKRFGVKFEVIEEHNPILDKVCKVPCPEYWVWHKHWNDWKNDFTDETWDNFMKTPPTNKEAIAEFLPKTKWKTPKEEPINPEN